MEAAIAWLIEAILATLLIDKLDAWIRRVGLADDTDKLKSEIRRIKIVVSAVRDKGIGNELLAEPLALLQDHLYEADDVVNELDYYRLQDQVQGVTIDDYEGVHGREDENLRGDTDAPRNSSVGKLRSVVWEHFTIRDKDEDGKPVKSACRYCSKELTSRTKNGTSSMRKHLEDEHSMTFTKNPTGAHAPNPSSASEPIVISSSDRGKGKKRRSKAWGLVDVIEEEKGKPMKAKCKYCPTQINCGGSNGTGSIHNHHKICKKKPGPNDQPSNPSSTSDVSASATPTVVGDSSSRKRRITDEDSTQITAANTHTSWDKTIYSNIIQKITSQLQDDRGEVSEVLKLRGSDFASSSNHHQSTGLDQHLRTSSFAPTKVYGRVAEKNSIINMITEEKSVCVAVLPIVGIAGVGKTVLAQLVYNDLDVKKLFHHRVWVWVSRNFDEVRLMREMLDFIPEERTKVHEERHERIRSFVKLQEILASRANSKRILFILDDVWNDMTDGRWENLLKPIKSGCGNGSVILVTTRDVSVAKMTGTTEHIKLGALEHEEFRLLFKSHAFGDENYMGDQNLCDIGQKIAEKLKGNPLAAESTGKLLKEKLNVDSWNKILKDEVWISVQLSGGIMAALKLSYDQLPYNLQQCFAYCSIFPDGYQFHGGELARIWISQGFMKGNCSSKILEEIERNYLTPLVNLGFFQQVEREESSAGTQTCYAVCGLMHDFARIVSLTEYATINGLECNKISPTLRHLSIVTGSEYRKDEHGNIPRNEKFEKNLRDTVTAVSKLRTLVLLGHYDSFFLQLFQHIFEKAHNLRLLQMSARSADFLKCGYDKLDGTLPRVLSKLYHLRVLNVGSYTDPAIPDGINNLVSLQHLVVHKGVYSSTVSMKSFQEPHGFKFQMSSGFEMTQLQSTNESVQHWMHVKMLEEAYEAALRNNELSEKLSWEKTSADTDMELEHVEPRQDVNGLQIFGRYGGASATWLTALDSNICTSFQTVHIYKCEEWKILPSLGRFPFLTKLMLSNLGELKEVFAPSLEELILVQMPKLERCSCTSVEGMNSSLRALRIEDCEALKEFDLFENHDKFEIEQGSWLPGLRKLILRDCPHLKVLNPLPPSATCSELVIAGVPILPSMEGASSETLQIGYLDTDGYADIDDSSDGLRILDYKILEFHNLKNLRSMRIVGCRNLISLSFEGFSHLMSLRSLEISLCEQLFSPDGMPDGTHEDVTALNCKAFPSLGSLDIDSCGIEGKWLSLMLQHAPQLEKLRLTKCPHITTIILIEEGENSKSNHILAREDSSSTGLVRDERLHIPLQTPSSLNNITIINGPDLFDLFEDDGKFEIEQRTSLLGLRKLVILSDCPRLEVLSPLPPSTTISELLVCGVSLLPSMQGSYSENLRIGRLEDYEDSIDEYSDELRILDDKILAFRNLTNLKSMTIAGCRNLTSFSLEGFSHLVSLKKLELQMCEKLFSSVVIAEYIFGHVTAFPSLQSLSIGSCGITGEWLCLLLQHAPVLEELHLEDILAIQEGDSLPVQIPLNLISSLKKASIRDCPRLTFKWSEEGFSGCTSLQELNISGCPKLLSSLVHNKDKSDDPANGRLLLPASLEEFEISNNYSQKTLQPCFPSDLTSLKRLELQAIPDLECLQLRSCTALEILVIKYCKSLTALEGLQSLGSLRHLDVYGCPDLGPCLESSFSMQGYELCSRLETFHVTEPSVFTTSSCVGLTSLQRLKLQDLVLTEEQGRALGLLTCLQELEFYNCYNLVDLPARLHLLPSLKRLKIEWCRGISRLPERGLPHSLEQLEIEFCSKELADQCRLLAATSKLNVKISHCS